jgi:peptidyl-prolyl cis-trans isomerase B (cyclophilin B)
VAGKKERQRRLAREKYERQQARRVHHDRRWRNILIIALVCLTVVGTGTGAYFLLRGGSKPASAAAASAHPSTSPSGAASAVTAEPASHCTYQASPPAARKVGAPPATPDSKASYQATIVTNRGDVVIRLLNAKATCTVNSFVYLAAKKYFNNTRCHRLTTSSIYVLQCGDPTGTGSGGPSYTFADENPPLNFAVPSNAPSPSAGSDLPTEVIYPAGTLAMANSGPNTNGSQFFIVWKDSPLAPKYTVFGKLSGGMDVVQKIAAGGANAPDAHQNTSPKLKVTVDTLSVTADSGKSTPTTNPTPSSSQS